MLESQRVICACPLLPDYHAKLFQELNLDAVVIYVSYSERELHPT